MAVWRVRPGLDTKKTVERIMRTMSGTQKEVALTAVLVDETKSCQALQHEAHRLIAKGHITHGSLLETILAVMIDRLPTPPDSLLSLEQYKESRVRGDYIRRLQKMVAGRAVMRSEQETLTQLGALPTEVYTIIKSPTPLLFKELCVRAVGSVQHLRSLETKMTEYMKTRRLSMSDVVHLVQGFSLCGNAVKVAALGNLIPSIPLPERSLSAFARALLAIGETDLHLPHLTRYLDSIAELPRVVLTPADIHGLVYGGLRCGWQPKPNIAQLLRRLVLKHLRNFPSGMLGQVLGALYLMLGELPLRERSDPATTTLLLRAAEHGPVKTAMLMLGVVGRHGTYPLRPSQRCPPGTKLIDRSGVVVTYIRGVDRTTCLVSGPGDGQPRTASYEDLEFANLSDRIEGKWLTPTGEVVVEKGEALYSTGWRKEFDSQQQTLRGLAPTSITPTEIVWSDGSKWSPVAPGGFCARHAALLAKGDALLSKVASPLTSEAWAALLSRGVHLPRVTEQLLLASLPGTPTMHYLCDAVPPFLDPPPNPSGATLPSHPTSAVVQDTIGALFSGETASGVVVPDLTSPVKVGTLLSGVRYATSKWGGGVAVLVVVPHGHPTYEPRVLEQYALRSVYPAAEIHAAAIDGREPSPAPTELEVDVVLISNKKGARLFRPIAA